MSRIISEKWAIKDILVLNRDPLSRTRPLDPVVSFFLEHEEFNACVLGNYGYVGDSVHGIDSIDQYEPLFKQVLGETRWNNLIESLNEHQMSSDKLVRKLLGEQADQSAGRERISNYLNDNTPFALRFNGLSSADDRFMGGQHDIDANPFWSKVLLVRELMNQYDIRKPRFANDNKVSQWEFFSSDQPGMLPAVTLSSSDSEESFSRRLYEPVEGWNVDDLSHLLDINIAYLEVWEAAATLVVENEIAKRASCSKTQLINFAVIFPRSGGPIRIPGSPTSYPDWASLLYREFQYAQDGFHVRVSEKDEAILNTSVDIPLLQSILHKNIGIICCDVISEKTEPLVGLKGGNMFVYEEIAFIGADELVKYGRHESLRQRIGAASADPSGIESALRNSIFGSSQKGHIIWVGSTSESDRLSTTYDAGLGFQPMYHIDLFFHPIGYLTKEHEVEKEFFYFIGSMEPGKYAAGQKTYYEPIQNFLSRTGQLLFDQIKGLGYKPRPVRIEQSVWFDISPTGGVAPNFTIFLNGLLYSDGKRSKYLFPKDSSVSRPNTWKGKRFAELECSAKSKMEDLLGKGNVIDVGSGDYTGISGLHCLVKVLKRSTSS